MPGNRYKTTPREYVTPVLMPAVYGLDRDVAELEEAVAALQAVAFNGGSGSGGSTSVNIQKANGSWSVPKAVIDAVHASGGVVLWVTRAGLPAPTAADGVAEGDAINGQAWTIPAADTTTTVGTAPTAQDGTGTSSDTVTLTKATGVTYTVDGVDHPSSSFTGATKVVPYTKGTNTTVTARPESGYVLTGATSWPLTFTNTTSPADTGGTPGSVITSDDFSSGARTLAVGNDLYTTNAALGGTGKLVDISGTACNITAAGTLQMGSGASFWLDNATSATLSAKIAAIGASGTIDLKVARATGDASYVTASLAANNKSCTLFVKQTNGTITNGGSITVQAGDVIEVTKKGTAASLKAWRGSTQVGSTANATLTADFTFASTVITATAAGYEFDDLKIIAA